MKFGRKIIACPLSWLFYWLGDFTSHIMHAFDWAFLYPIYNRLMIWSFDIQEWGGDDFGPWKHG